MSSANSTNFPSSFSNLVPYLYFLLKRSGQDFPGLYLKRLKGSRAASAGWAGRKWAWSDHSHSWSLLPHQCHCWRQFLHSSTFCSDGSPADPYPVFSGYLKDDSPTPCTELCSAKLCWGLLTFFGVFTRGPQARQLCQVSGSRGFSMPTPAWLPPFFVLREPASFCSLPWLSFCVSSWSMLPHSPFCMLFGNLNVGLVCP